MIHLDLWQIAMTLICGVTFVAFCLMAYVIFSLSQELDRLNGTSEEDDPKWK